MSKLSAYFDGVAAKRLSAVEVDSDVSNQHEFGGVAPLRAILGEVTAEKPKLFLPARFLYLGENEDDTLRDEGTLTWYDSRTNQPNRSAEYRLYVPDNSVYGAAAPDDLLVVGKRQDGSLLVIIVRAGSTYASQVQWLFGLEDELFRFTVQDITNGHDRDIGFAERFILEELGVEPEESDDEWLDQLLAAYPNGFPKTKVFSAFARGTLPDVSAEDDPDAALMAWMDREELLFRTLERHFVQQRLATGFDDVDDFVQFSLSVHNRRKSRVGYALENQLEVVFSENSITYDRGKQTENRAKPDFVFPGIEHYRDTSFSADRLTMLGVKSTCKDRWRQVLSEAARIPEKHLLTLEPGISSNQTDEMQANQLQLVLPASLHTTYAEDQQAWLMDLYAFISAVRIRQST